MSITPEQHYELVVAYKNLNEIAVYLGLREEHLQNPGTGKWLIDRVKQMEQVIRMHKTELMVNNAVQSIETHDTTTPLPHLTDQDPNV